MRFYVFSGAKYHKKTGQRSDTLKPLHILEDLSYQKVLIWKLQQVDFFSNSFKV